VHAAVAAHEDEGGQRCDAETTHETAIGVAEHEKPVDERSEKLLRFVGSARQHEVDSHIGAPKRLENASRRLQHPRAFVGERVEDNAGEVESGEPLLERARIAGERGERCVESNGTSHNGQR